MYYCQMPECEYICEDKSQIHFHHIIPSSLGGNNRDSNLIGLCPNCHTRVYVPEMEYGMHSIKHSNSIILISKMLSTGGQVISYKTIDDDEVKYSLMRGEIA